MNDKELKPCPFCGETRIEDDKYYEYDGYKGESPTYKIHCSNCHAMIKGFNHSRLKELWNRRAAGEICLATVKLNSEQIDEVLSEAKAYAEKLSQEVEVQARKEAVRLVIKDIKYRGIPFPNPSAKEMLITPAQLAFIAKLHGVEVEE